MLLGQTLPHIVVADAGAVYNNKVVGARIGLSFSPCAGSFFIRKLFNWRMLWSRYQDSNGMRD